VSRPE